MKCILCERLTKPASHSFRYGYRGSVCINSDCLLFGHRFDDITAEAMNEKLKELDLAVRQRDAFEQLAGELKAYSINLEQERNEARDEHKAYVKHVDAWEVQWRTERDEARRVALKFKRLYDFEWNKNRKAMYLDAD